MVWHGWSLAAFTRDQFQLALELGLDRATREKDCGDSPKIPFIYFTSLCPFVHPRCLRLCLRRGWHLAQRGNASVSNLPVLQ